MSLNGKVSGDPQLDVALDRRPSNQVLLAPCASPLPGTLSAPR